MVVVVVGTVVVVVGTVVVVVDIVVVLDDVVATGGFVEAIESAAVSAAQLAANTVAMHTIPSERIAKNRIEPAREATWGWSAGIPLAGKAWSKKLSTQKSRQERPDPGTLRPT